MDEKASDSERQRAREIAEAVLDGRTTILEGVRELVYLAHTDAIAKEADRMLIIGIDSETDHLPVGAVRKLWAADERYRDCACRGTLEDDFLDACKRIAAADCR
jgi:hypothetical protein